MTKIAIRFVGLPCGPGTKFDGWFFKSFDHEAFGGQGDADFTEDPAEALSFPTMMDAIQFVHRVPACCPLRADFLPNRPMTASTNEMVTLEP